MWNSIDTAPKDGTFILVYQGAEDGPVYTGKGDVGVAAWARCGLGSGNGWMAKDCCDGVVEYSPTHWMPLPRPPADAPDDWAKHIKWACVR